MYTIAAVWNLLIYWVFRFGLKWCKKSNFISKWPLYFLLVCLFLSCIRIYFEHTIQILWMDFTLVTLWVSNTILTFYALKIVCIMDWAGLYWPSSLQMCNCNFCRNEINKHFEHNSNFNLSHSLDLAYIMFELLLE